MRNPATHVAKNAACVSAIGKEWLADSVIVGCLELYPVLYVL